MSFIRRLISALYDESVFICFSTFSSDAMTVVWSLLNIFAMLFCDISVFFLIRYTAMWRTLTISFDLFRPVSSSLVTPYLS